jgi:uncharacterized protein (TIGR02147 family)
MDYTEMLKQEYIDRKVRRPSYSERAFARDLKVSPGYVSLLFRGQRGLSPAKGFEIAQRLGWPEEKANHFVASIQKKNLMATSVSSSKLKSKNGPSGKFVELELDSFRFIADLNHLAALTLVQSRKGLSSESIAETLGISVVEADLVTARLKRLGLIIQERNNLRCSKASIEIKEVPSEAIRSLHRQAIQKAEASIDEQPVEGRNLAALTLSFNVEKMIEAKLFINRFLKAFEKKFGNANHGEIYQMNTQFFKLSREAK